MENQSLSSPLAGRSGLFVVGLLLIIGLFAVAAWWVFRPSYVALYKDASEASQAEILASLGQWHLPYRINAKEGLIEVPADTVAAARMHLAESGIPTRAGVGFELFDQADYGMSEFSQKINYQRALEGELARTVMSIAEVQYARVHLTFKKTGLYQHAEEQAKASVIVRLRSGAILDTQKVRGIQQLVASAVEGMAHERVVVLDEDGRLLSQADGAASAPEHQQMAAQIERDLQAKAEHLLRRPLGSAGAEVSVRVQMNFDRIKSVRELPLGGGKESLRHAKEVSSSETSAGTSDGKRSQNTRETEYVVGKERAEIEHAAGKIERISVGVVLTAALADEDVKEMRGLLEVALGLDAQRGDQLVIAYIPETPLAAVEAETIMPLDAPTAPSVSLTEAVSAPAVQPDAQSPSWLRWGVAGLAAVLSLALLLLWSRTRTRRVAAVEQPRLSSVEREQLLGDLRRWLVEGR
jgi:flagellar M-ring protein FliF